MPRFTFRRDSRAAHRARSESETRFCRRRENRALHIVLSRPRQEQRRSDGTAHGNRGSLSGNGQQRRLSKACRARRHGYRHGRRRGAAHTRRWEEQRARCSHRPGRRRADAGARDKDRSVTARQATYSRAFERGRGHGRVGIESYHRSTQQRGKSPLDRRSIDTARSRPNLESRHRQGGSVMSVTINTKINGQSVSASADASTSLLEFLRDVLEMKGSKLCCNTGECGACTVIYNGKPINSCVTMAADANGAEIVTIEGLANGDKLHPVQQAFIDTGAVQCGYCTPGYIMSVKALLDRTTKPTQSDIEEAVSGNICRCTGYNKIVDAIHLAADRIAGRA